MGYIIGFSTIFLILSSNIIISHQNFSIAYPYVNEVFDELNRYAIIAVQDTERNFETSASISNPNLDDWKKKLCENGIQEDNKIGTPLICNPSEKTDDKSTDDQQNTETSDKINKKMEKLNEKLEKSLSNNGINVKSHLEDSPSETKNIDDNRGNTERNNDNNENNDIEDNDVNKDKDNQLLEQQQSSEDQEESKAEGGENYDSNNDDNRGNTERNNDKNENNDNEDNVGIAGLDLNIDKKLTDADKKIENLKDKVNKENNNLLFDQVEENIAKEKNNKAKENDNKDQDNNEQNLGITGLDSKIQKIQTNLEKQIEKLKDKFENERDNQRLIEQRNEFDDDDDDGDSKDDDDKDGKNYDGYGFNGDNDNGKENAEENFNFAAAGDFGCSTNTKNTVENMQSKEPEIVLALGDLSYHSTADCWFDMMSPIKDKLMITLGHHDVEDGQAKMDQYLNSFGLEKPFYSYEYDKVHFLVMSAKSVYNKGSEQYNFILEDLKKASENKDVNWIVVSSYGPPYTSPSEHTAFKELRDVYHPIFEKYGVDLVLSGHNHNYQRTHPITYNPNDSSEPVVTNDHSAEYSQKDGIVFAIVGTGGVNFYSFDGQAPFVDTQFANKFGFLNIDISNGNPHTKLTGTFYDNKGDQILDQFTIDKEIENKNSEVISN